MLSPDDVSTTIKHTVAARNGAALLDIVIVGGGLSGLMVANQIHHTLPPTTTWKLLEARPVLGGRLANEDGNDNPQIDLGGAWIWPNHQPFMRKLAADAALNITTFRQPDDPSSTRIDGGAVQFIHALAKDLPSENILLNAPVTQFSLLRDETPPTTTPTPTATTLADDQECADGSTELVIQVQTTTTTATSSDDGSNNETTTFLARRVVIAAPPRLVSKYMQFMPPLSKEKQQAMAASHTWMAGVTKIALIYPKRFWNTDSSNMGFPAGKGPAFQVYDASTKTNSVAALTFFAMVPPNNKAKDDDAALADQVSTQLADIWNHFQLPFAAQAKSYTQVLVKRWPLESYLSEDAAPTQIHPHPRAMKALSEKEWNNQLLFAGSETDRTSPGVMEGAVGAAMRVVYNLQAVVGSNKK